MSDHQSDLAMQEVDDELRRERMQALWQRFGKYIIGGAVGIILVVAGREAYSAFVVATQEKNAEEFAAAAVRAVEAGDDAAAVWDDVAPNLSEGYKVFAGFREAAAHIRTDRFDAAITVYDRVASSGEVSESYNDLARLLAAMVIIEHKKDYDDAAARLSVIAKEGRTWFYSAQEQIGLLHLLKGDRDAARSVFGLLSSTEGTPQSIRTRANEFRAMLEAPITVVERGLLTLPTDSAHPTEDNSEPVEDNSGPFEDNSGDNGS